VSLGKTVLPDFCSGPLEDSGQGTGFPPLFKAKGSSEIIVPPFSVDHKEGFPQQVTPFPPFKGTFPFFSSLVPLSVFPRVNGGFFP